MGLDHSNAFVRVTFDGLITFCFNKRAEPATCEMGMVRVEDHARRLIITKINPNGTEELLYDPFDLNDHNRVTIEAVHPVDPGVRRYQPDLEAYPFHHINDLGDPEDFRWVADLQGPRFHGRELSMRRGDEDYKCKPKIIIPHGTFYTHSKTPHQYIRIPRKVNTGVHPLGKLADKVGADIVCHPIYGKVIVKIEGIRTITLESDGLKTRYRIDVQNLCRTGRVIASDFPHYYKIAKDLDGIEFDLIYQVLTGAPGITRSLEDCVRERSGFSISLPEGFEKFGANGPPQVCNVTFMGETNTIPE